MDNSWENKDDVLAHYGMPNDPVVIPGVLEKIHISTVVIF